MTPLDILLLGIVNFGRNTIGIVRKPYETYRHIAERSAIAELAPLALLICIYLACASLVKAPLFRPYFLTREFVLLGSSVGLTFLVMVGLIFLVGQWVGSRGNLRGIMMTCAYTLVPTL